MHWILQANLFRENEWETLVNTLERMGLPYSVHKVIPFIGELEPPADVNDSQVICFGSYSMRHTAKKMGWTPGVYDLFDQDFEVQKAHWGERMLNHDSVVVPFGQARFDEPMFIRPVDDSKYFAGRMIDPEEFRDWQHKVCDLKEDTGTSLEANTLIQVSSPKAIQAEYRYWVVDGAIVTRSLYKRGSKVVYSSQVDERVDAFVNEAIAVWQPHRAFVIDVCDTDQGMKIVEINTLNSAGFYAGDMPKLIMALEAMEAPQPAHRARP